MRETVRQPAMDHDKLSLESPARWTQVAMKEYCESPKLLPVYKAEWHYACILLTLLGEQHLVIICPLE